MFTSVLLVFHLFQKRLKFLRKFRYEIARTNAVGSNIAKYHNILVCKVSPLPKQNLLVTKLIRLYLRVHKISQVHGVSKGSKNLPTRLLFENFCWKLERPNWMKVNFYQDFSEHANRISQNSTMHNALKISSNVL